MSATTRGRMRADVLLDLHIYGGLALAALGGWQLSPAWTLVLVGGVLVTLGLGASLRSPNPKRMEDMP